MIKQDRFKLLSPQQTGVHGLPQKGQEWHEDYVGEYGTGRFRADRYAFNDEQLLADAALAQAVLREEIPEQAGAPDPETTDSEQQPAADEEPEQLP